MWDKKYLDELDGKREEAAGGGGPARIEKQHAKGKMTARERLDYLFDEGSFQEVGSLIESRFTDFGMGEKKLPGDGVVTGFGTVGGRPVYAAAEDFTVLGVNLGEYHSNLIYGLHDFAYDCKAPFISFNDLGGARIV